MRPGFTEAEGSITEDISSYINGEFNEIKKATFF